MKFLSVTYIDGSTDYFEDISNYDRYIDKITFTYNPTNAISKNVFTYIRMEEVRKLVIWETDSEDAKYGNGKGLAMVPVK